MSRKRGQKEPLTLTKEEWLLVAEALNERVRKTRYVVEITQLFSIIARIERHYGGEE